MLNATRVLRLAIAMSVLALCPAIGFTAEASDASDKVAKRPAATDKEGFSCERPLDPVTTGTEWRFELEGFTATQYYQVFYWTIWRKYHEEIYSALQNDAIVPSRVPGKVGSVELCTILDVVIAKSGKPTSIVIKKETGTGLGRLSMEAIKAATLPPLDDTFPQSNLRAQGKFVINVSDLNQFKMKMQRLKETGAF